MSTLNHEVWANPTTPLFLQSGTNVTNIAPLVLDSPDLAQATTITATTTNGGIFYAPAASGESQAYGSLSFSNAGGWALKTNGFPQLTGQVGGQGGLITTGVPLYIASPSTSGVLQLTQNSIGDPFVPASRITFEPTSINLGKQVIAQDGDGLIVQTTDGVTASITQPTQQKFVTNTYTYATTTYDFIATILPSPPNAYTTTNNVDGFVMSSSAPPIYASGVTLINPLYSPVAVSPTGTTPSSTKAIWLGTAPNITAKTMYVEFPTINAPVGTPIGVQWKQAGVYSYGAVYKNDIPLADITSSSSSTWVTSASYNFTSTGDDRVYIEISTASLPDISGYYYFNISDIAISSGTPVQTTYGSMGLNGSTIRMTNTSSGSYVEADSSAGGASLNSSPANGTSVVVTNKVRLNSATNGVEVNGSMNMLSNAISNCPSVFFTGSNSIVGSFANTLSLTASNISNVGNLNISSGNIVMSNNNILDANLITTDVLDAPNASSYIVIGNSSLGASVSNAIGIRGATGGATLSNIKYLNNDAACATGIFHYLVSFDGTKAVSAPLPPKQTISGRNNNTFGSNYAGDSFVSSVGFTLPAYSIFTYSNISSGTPYVFSNTNTIPYYYPDTGSGFSPSASTQVYSLVPIIV